MALQPWEAMNDFVYGCLDEEEGKAFLVQGSHRDGEWCCDVCDCPRSQWSIIQRLKRKGERVRGYDQGGGKVLVNVIPHGTGVHESCRNNTQGTAVSEIGTKKGLAESDDDGILTPTPGDG